MVSIEEQHSGPTTLTTPPTTPTTPLATPTKRSTQRFARYFPSGESPSLMGEIPLSSPQKPKPRRALFKRNKDQTPPNLYNDTPPGDRKSELRRQVRKGSLADFDRAKRGSESDQDPLSLSEDMPLLQVPAVGSVSGLEVASHFGFMIESCILASRQTGVLHCPAHPDHPLPVEHIAPDLVSFKPGL